MLNRTLEIVMLACLVTGMSSGEKDPFVGRWKVNPAKSKPTDQMKIEAAGTNRYTLTFFPGITETILADGSDQPGMRGTTFSITVNGPNNWQVTRKKAGRTLLTANWMLSADGNTLTDAYTEYEPNGSTLNLHYVYERTGGTSGVPGTWLSVGEGVNAATELRIRPFDGDGLSFESPAGQITRNIKFDGKDYPDVGANAVAGTTSSGRRVNQRSLEITDKIEGNVTGTRQIELSQDLKTLTITVRNAADSKIEDILVFDRR